MEPALSIVCVEIRPVTALWKVRMASAATMVIVETRRGAERERRKFRPNEIVPPLPPYLFHSALIYHAKTLARRINATYIRPDK